MIASAAAVAAAVACFVLTELARRWLTIRGIVDVPNHRSSHVHQTPRGGGIVVAAVSVLASVTAWTFDPWLSTGLVVVMSGAILVGCVGLIDDIRDLSVGLRLFAQGGLSLGVVAVLGATLNMPTGLYIGFTVAAAVLMVGSMNAFNFMDGIDGIAGLTSVAFAAPTGIVAMAVGQPAVTVVSAAIAGAVVGFLIHNWSPARIFLGDCGSLYLGFLASGLPLLIAVDDRRGVLLLCAQVPFLGDASLTILRRKFRGERITDAHRDHVYQRASRRWGHGPVAAAYGLAALIICVSALVAGWAELWYGAAVAILAAVGVVISWLVLSSKLDRHCSEPSISV